MSVKITIDGDTMTAYLIGEIDHHTAKEIRSQIDEAAGRGEIKMLYIDFYDVSFMDSSGIGLVMGRYNLMRELNGKVTITNVSYHIKKVMKLAGLDRLVVIEDGGAK